MYVDEKSDEAIVLAKRLNKGRQLPAEGMKTLLRQGLQRLSGTSGQAVFELKQAMGGGKTHSMLALALATLEAETIKGPKARGDPGGQIGVRDPERGRRSVVGAVEVDGEEDVKFNKWTKQKLKRTQGGNRC
jgi:hypothetical protein